jgi:hypothetical protein
MNTNHFLCHAKLGLLFHYSNNLLLRFYRCVLCSCLQNILAHYSFGFIMYFDEKWLKIVKIRINVRECKQRVVHICINGFILNNLVFILSLIA